MPKLALALALAANLASASERMVFFIAGQSNAVGIGCDHSQIPAGMDSTFVSIPIHSTINGGASSGWVSLKPGVASDGWCIGPELSLGVELQKKFPTKKIALVKYAYSAKTLVADYTPPSATQAAGPMYTAMLAEWTGAMASKTFTEDTIKLSGFFWMQGEGDCYPPASTAYDANLKAFIASVRKDFAVADLPFVLGMIDSVSAPQVPSDINTVRNAQRDAVATLANVYAVETSDLGIDDAPALFPYHFSAAGQIGLGTRWAAALPLPYVQPAALATSRRLTAVAKFTRFVDLLGRAATSSQAR